MIVLLLMAAGAAHAVFYSDFAFIGWLFVPLTLMAGFATVACWRIGRRAEVALFVSQLILAFCGGALLGALHLHSLIADALPAQFDKQSVVLTFDINRVQQASANSPIVMRTTVVAAQFPSAIANSEPVYSLVGKQLRLSWYRPSHVMLAGQRWRAEVVVRRPRGFVNPNGFDYAAWILSEGYSATGYIKSRHQPELLAVKGGLLPALREHLEGQLAGVGAAAPFLNALLLGQREGISPDQWQVLQATGTVHLMAISGLHVGLVAGLGFLLGLLGSRLLVRVGMVGVSGWCYRLLPVALAIGLAAFYALLAGLAVPTRRALLAVVLINLAWLLGLKASRWQVFALVLLLVVLTEPMAALQSGFWLSFAAVATLGVFLSGSYRSAILQRGFRWRQVIRLQCLLTLAMCFPLWLLGLPTSVLAPAANLIAVPLVAFGFVPALLLWIPLSFTPVGPLFIDFLGMLFDGLWWLLTFLGSIPYAAFWPLQSHSPWLLALGLVALIMLMLPRSQAMRVASLGVMGLVLLGSQAHRTDFELVVLDVGQGLAVVVQEPDHSVLYDTGPAFSPRFNAGANIIAPYLRAQGLGLSRPFSARPKPLSLVVSHGDKDHSGGAPAIIQQFALANLWVGETFLGMPSEAKFCQQGQHWRWQRADYSVLWPPVDGNQHWQNNNASCVILVEYLGFRFLLAGDIESEAEHALVAAGNLPGIDVLIAPHHGSKTSSSLAFLKAVSPRHIVVSASYKGPYGHPHASITARYAAIGAKQWNTATDGAITFRVINNELEVMALKQQRPKLWY